VAGEKEEMGVLDPQGLTSASGAEVNANLAWQ
jgi:hypothetical protein